MPGANKTNETGLRWLQMRRCPAPSAHVQARGHAGTQARGHAGVSTHAGQASYSQAQNIKARV